MRLTAKQREVLRLRAAGERFRYVENGDGTRCLMLVPSYTPVHKRTFQSLKRKGLLNL